MVNAFDKSTVGDYAQLINTPEVLRELRPLQSIAAAVNADTTIIINDTAVAADEQLFVWGVSFVTSSVELVTGDFQDHDNTTSYFKFGATRNASYNWMSNLPLPIARGEGLQLTNATSAAQGAQLSDTLSVITVWYQKVKVDY